MIKKTIWKWKEKIWSLDLENNWNETYPHCSACGWNFSCIADFKIRTLCNWQPFIANWNENYIKMRNCQKILHQHQMMEKLQEKGKTKKEE